jgi:hypothetical protein
MKSQTKQLVLLLLAILLGAYFQYTNPITAILFMILSIVLVLVTVTLLVIGLFNRKFKMWYLIPIVPIIVAISYSSSIRAYKHRQALSITESLEQFKGKYGAYPVNLGKLNNKIELSGLNYLTDSTFQEYEIEYLMDEFNREFYNSNTKKWDTKGWND